MVSFARKDNLFLRGNSWGQGNAFSAFIIIDISVYGCTLHLNSFYVSQSTWAFRYPSLKYLFSHAIAI
jgi:hypothetical protein